MRHFNLVLAAVWLALTLFFLLREPMEWLYAAVAGILALWNIARWVASAPRRSNESSQLQPHRERAAPAEYNPDFDFQKMDREKNQSGG